MGVDRKLLSEFIKLTNDNSEEQKPKIVHGTIVTKNGVDHVKIDGSEIATPFRPTIEVKRNDRVLVDISNHKVRVTGNLSDPSSSGDRVTELQKEVDGIDITGVVRFHDLAGEGTTTINGANIQTGTLKAETISGGVLNGITLKVADGATIRGFSVADMWISSADLTQECYQLKVMPDAFYNNGPGLGYTSGLYISGSGNGSVAKDMWANSFSTRNLSYATFMDNKNRMVANPWDILNSMHVINTDDGLRIYTPDSQNEYTTYMNPVLKVNENSNVGLDLESTIATLVNAVKELKQENQILKEKLGVL